LQGAALSETKWNSKEMVLSLRKRVPSRNYVITHHIIAKTLKEGMKLKLILNLLI